MITAHKDLFVCFQDVSIQLLISPPWEPLQHDFPRLLPSITIDLTSLFSDPSIAGRFPPDFLHSTRIASVHLSTEALECHVVLTMGEVVVYRLRSGETSKAYRHAEDKELTILEHIPRMNSAQFNPYLMLALGRGPVVAYATSDIGAPLPLMLV
jgi:hypothetical protein